MKKSKLIEIKKGINELEAGKSVSYESFLKKMS